MKMRLISVAAVTLAVGICALFLRDVYVPEFIHQESPDGLLENMQLVVLLASVILWSVLGKKLLKKDTHADSLYPQLAFFFAAMYLHFIGRELTWGRSIGGTHGQWVVFITLNTVITLAAGGWLLWYWIKHEPDKKASIVTGLKSNWFFYSFLTLVLLYIGMGFEFGGRVFYGKSYEIYIPLFDVKTGQFFEELFELFAYLVVCCIPWYYLRRLKRGLDT